MQDQDRRSCTVWKPGRKTKIGAVIAVALAALAVLKAKATGQQPETKQDDPKGTEQA